MEPRTRVQSLSGGARPDIFNQPAQAATQAGFSQNLPHRSARAGTKTRTGTTSSTDRRCHGANRVLTGIKEAATRSPSTRELPDLRGACTSIAALLEHKKVWDEQGDSSAQPKLQVRSASDAEHSGAECV